MMHAAIQPSPVVRSRLSRTRRRHARGFTLIELMVALAILAIVLSSVYATFYSGVKAMRDRHGVDDAYLVARVVMETITNDLSMAHYRSGIDQGERVTQGFIGSDGEDGEYARDRLDFTTSSHILVHDGRPETDVVEVSYYIDDTYTDRPLLVRREDPLPDDTIRHGGTLRILAEDVVALNFRYREPDDMPASRTQETRDDESEQLEWVDAWNAEKHEGGKTLPQLVEVSVTILDEEGHEHTFGTTVLLHPYQYWSGR
jgi:general secretion pathway protein J